MTKASKKLLLAFMTIAVCLALLVTGTYALFSTQVGVENHLVAGNLSVTLVRDKLVTVSLGENGHLTRTTDEGDKDFTNATKENLFGIEEGVKIAPDCSFTADMVLTNSGSVAISYWIEIKLEGTANELAEQLLVTVASKDVPVKEVGKSLKDGLTLGSEEDGVGIVEVKSSANFSVTVEFQDLDTNNDAQGQEVTFDLIVHAIQDATVTPAA